MINGTVKLELNSFNNLLNNRMKKVLNTGNYPNIKIVDNQSNFLRVTDEANRKFKWSQKSNIF